MNTLDASVTKIPQKTTEFINEQNKRLSTIGGVAFFTCCSSAWIMTIASRAGAYELIISGLVCISLVAMTIGLGYILFR